MLKLVLTGRLVRAVLVVMAGLLLAACEEYAVPKDQKPVPAALVAKMKKLDMAPTAPVYMRAYKETSELEVWKRTRSGTYQLLTTYSICKWSGKLGPKIKEGDRQAPEGFYTITPSQMNPKSSYYLSFNIGFPNAFDRAHGRTGSNLMVHGACSSAGCYSMTDAAAGEIYALARDAFRGGQRSFEVHLFPFRMTAENMARHRDDPNYDFWVMLKEGSDNFLLTAQVPKVGVCDKRYVFNANASQALNASAACPPLNQSPVLLAALKAKTEKDNLMIAQLAPVYAQEQLLASAAAAEQTARIAAGGVDQPLATETAAIDASVAVPAPGMPLPVSSPALAVAPLAPAAATGAAEAVAAIGAPPAVAAPEAPLSEPMIVGGEPAPDMPLPVASPLRPVMPVVPVVAPAPPPDPGFWGTIKKRIPKVPNPFG